MCTAGSGTILGHFKHFEMQRLESELRAGGFHPQGVQRIALVPTSVGTNWGLFKSEKKK